MKKHVVVARYQENVDWTKECVPQVSIVQKESDLPNFGREPSSFLWYIVRNYDQLDGLYFFCQGNPFDHCKHMLNYINTVDFGPGFTWLGNQSFESCGDGSPSHPGLPVAGIHELLTERNFPGRVMFAPGGQFCVGAETIKKHPKSYYQRCYDLLKSETQAPWVFERIWEELFK